MTSFLKNYTIIRCFYFWRVLLVITNPPLYDYLTTFFFDYLIYDYFSPSYTLTCQYLPIHFRKIDMTTKNLIGFIRFPTSLFRGEMMITRKRHFYSTLFWQCTQTLIFVQHESNFRATQNFFSQCNTF